MLKTAFFGTPDFAVPMLDELAARTRVVMAVCQPDRPAGRGQRPRPPPVKARAAELGIPVLQPRRMKDPEFRAAFRAAAPELAVVAAYGRILPGDLLVEPRFGFVNVHASRLPRLRGAAPIHRAVLLGEASTGISIMQVTEGLDEGPVYLDGGFDLPPGITAGELHDRLAALGRRLLGEFLLELESRGGLPEAVPQDDAGATYAEKIGSEETAVRWEDDGAAVDRQVRGLSPWPGAWTSFRGERLGLVRSVGAEGSGLPGEILAVDRDGLVVACGRGAVRITEVKPAGKRAMGAADWSRGARIVPGERLAAPGVAS